MRNVFDKLNKNKKFNNFLTKHKIPKEFFSTRRKYILRGLIIGLLIAFIPMPMQMFTVLFFIPFLRFNIVVSLAMCWITNPITMPFIYLAEYKLGSWLLGIKVENINLSLEWITNNFSSIFLPLYTGAITFSLIACSIAYIGLNYLWKKDIEKRRGN
jgi:uncharacterized protein (DUF2062 family)